MKRKKIGIVTISENVPNYGQRLQCYVVQHLLNELGYDSEMIQDARWYANPVLFKTNWKDIAHCILRYHLIPERHGFRAVMYYWIKKHLHVSPLYVNSDEDMLKLPRMYDGFVVGSDQVWNPYYTTRGLNSFTTLQFAPKEKRIAYAASIASYSIPEERVDEFKTYLKDFGPITMREKSGAKIIKELTGRDVPVVIDPTLMWTGDSWAEKFMRKPNQENYMLLFLYGECTTEYNKKAKELANDKGLDVLNINKMPNVLDYSVESWFGFIKHSKYVLTNSFHCCVFSLLFHKNISVLRNPHIEMLMGSRIMDLFDLLGVEYTTEKFEQELITTTHITEKQWKDIEGRLEEERKKAWNYLQTVFPPQKD